MMSLILGVLTFVVGALSVALVGASLEFGKTKERMK